ncbi:MAG: tetratricopeptide repeat protein [Deltaproteobacteria bacterium]|nr:tetratricopeptide repeat protein [Deltaproteobacteria bacterium]MBW2444912.1 tetratricopeptide repeat protein [Deltaproteobacteria bacterium]
MGTADFRKLERQVRAMQATGAGSTGAAGEVADLGIRLDEIEERLKDVQGYLEQVDHRSKRALEEGQAARTDAAESRGDADTARRDAAEATRLLQQLREELATAARTSSAAPPAAAEPTMTIASVPAPTPAPEPAPRPATAPRRAATGAAGGTGVIEAYRSAYAAWRNDDTEACIDQFRQFLQTNASSPFADDAAFWMADCYFKQGDYKTAILRFDDVVSKYPSGNKAADALYRQGEALLRLGPGYSRAAGKAFDRVLREYPESDRAVEARRQLEILGTG